MRKKSLKSQYVFGAMRFQVRYTTNNQYSFEQCDIWVETRRSVETMELSDFTVEQLFIAYHGDDSAHLQHAYQQLLRDLRERERYQIRAIETERFSKDEQYQRIHAARVEAQRLHQEARALFAQQLMTKERTSFDVALAFSKVKFFGQQRLLRTMYFDEMDDQFIRDFCFSYATDSDYRTAVDEGTAFWVRRNALFIRNLDINQWRQELSMYSRGEASTRIHRFFQWVEAHTEAICALPDYQRIQQLGETESSPTESDPEIRDAVAAWDRIPGVQTKRFCQGISGTMDFYGTSILVPSSHDECAYILFLQCDASVVALVKKHVAKYPAIHFISFPGYPSEKIQPTYRLVSEGDNLAFREEALQLAQVVASEIQSGESR